MLERVQEVITNYETLDQTVKELRVMRDQLGVVSTIKIEGRRPDGSIVTFPTTAPFNFVPLIQERIEKLCEPRVAKIETAFVPPKPQVAQTEPDIDSILPMNKQA